MDRREFALKQLFLFCIIIAVVTGCSRRFVISGSPALQTYGIDTTIRTDSMVYRLYAPYKIQLEAEMSKVIGTAAFAIVRNREAPESLCGNFFADALLKAAKTIDQTVAMSFATKDGLRADLPEGNITVSHVFELMPFENETLIVEISGSKMKELLNFIAVSNGQPVSGLRMKIKDGVPQDILINGQAFDERNNYKVVTYDYLANGGDKVAAFLNPLNSLSINKKVRDIIMEEIREVTDKGNNINTQLDGRIELK